MRTSFALAILIILTISLGAGGIYYLYQKQGFKPQPFAKASPSPSLTTRLSVSPAPSSRTSVSPPQTFPSLTSPTPIASPQVLPQAGSETSNLKLTISVTKPQAQEKISSPVRVTGFANVLNGQVSIEIKDEIGKILGSGSATACLGINPCLFEASIIFTKPQTQKGSIDVFTFSLENDSQDYFQMIPVKF